jgi:hypothetical protein
VHEFGHALGFYHEEERDDAPNITTGNCAKQSYPNANPVEYGAYDQTGIMSYCQPPSGAPWFSPNDIAGIQRSYGRRLTSSLVSPRAHCASAHYADGLGDPAFTWDCNEPSNDQMWVDSTNASDGDAFNLSMGSTGSNRCLGSDVAATGNPVKVSACSTRTDWRFESMYLRGFGGLCLDLASGSLADGTPIQMWTCGALGGANQKWTRTRAGQLRYGTTSKCAGVSSNGALQLVSCSTSDTSQLFTFEAGAIKRKSNGMCLDVQGPSDSQYTSGQGLPGVGATIQQFACNSSLNQKWMFNGGLRYGANAGLCLSRNVDANGYGLLLVGCNGSEETQTWDYYF